MIIQDKLENDKEKSKGYLVVASRKPNFYSLAINCIESIKKITDAKVLLSYRRKISRWT